MKIGVLSDTHIPVAAKQLPSDVADILYTTDAIIHAGDYQNETFVYELQSMGEFHGVCGNMDCPAIKDMLPGKKVITLQGFKIGIIHGWGAPDGIEQRIESEFQDEKPDVIIFGHSHRPSNHIRHNTLFFNPGSPTDKRYSPFCSMGILHIEDTVKGEIIKVGSQHKL